jgi:hypothetical protein
MRKQIFTIMLILCVGLALGFVNPVTAEAASVKLTYSNFFPGNAYQRPGRGGIFSRPNVDQGPPGL